MIGKIDSLLGLGQKTSFNPSTQNLNGLEFHSLLQEKMAKDAPLERLAFELLKNTIDLILSEGEPREADPFLSSTPGSRPNPRSLPTSPPELQPVEIELDYEPSNYSPLSGNFESLIQEAGQKHGVDASLIKAVIQAESGGNPQAVSPAGARGLMQLMPGTAAELGVTNPFDPTQNIMGGTSYLRRLLDRYRGDVKLALAAYNWGMGNLEKRPEAMPKETKNYVAKVESQYRNSSKTWSSAIFNPYPHEDTLQFFAAFGRLCGFSDPSVSEAIAKARKEKGDMK
jgi:hypothetical protein